MAEENSDLLRILQETEGKLPSCYSIGEHLPHLPSNHLGANGVEICVSVPHWDLEQLAVRTAIGIQAVTYLGKLFPIIQRGMENPQSSDWVKEFKQNWQSNLTSNEGDNYHFDEAISHTVVSLMERIVAELPGNPKLEVLYAVATTYETVLGASPDNTIARFPSFAYKAYQLLSSKASQVKVMPDSTAKQQITDFLINPKAFAEKKGIVWHSQYEPDSDTVKILAVTPLR